MATLLVGFDSAWTARESGAIAAVVRRPDGSVCELGEPMTAAFAHALVRVEAWEQEHETTSTVVLIDQPTIVPNPAGQRHVENIVASPVSRRYGGMQPANTGRRDMFGPAAPIWSFLDQCGGAADPFTRDHQGRRVFETYPVLTLIALEWLLTDVANSRPTGRLPKYNPRRPSFDSNDWRHVCKLTASEFKTRGLATLERWIREQGRADRPTKPDQDKLDSCLCLLVALHLHEGRGCLVVGDMATGYILVPESCHLREELETRCSATGRDPGQWVRRVSW